MATPKRMKPYRSWSSVDSVDPNDVHRLCDSEIGEGGQKPSIPGGRCISTWTFSLVVLIISVFLLVGLFVGYYIRDGQNYSASDHPVCDYTFRTDGYGLERLEMVHENLMYLMSGQRITDTAGKMAAVSTQKSGGTSDEKMVNYIHENLKNLGLDKVETIKYQAEVVSLDPENPSMITVYKAGKEKLVLKPGEPDPSAKEEGGERGGEAPTLAVPGRGMGHLVYGFYGRKQDLFYVKKSNITLKNCVLLLKIGEISVLEKLRLASLESVSGLLLYQDPSDSPVSQGELESISYKLADGNSHIPLLLISIHESDQLLRELQDEGVASPEDWTDANGARPYMGIVSSNTTSPVVVKMKVNVIQREETITNVIGSIYGDMEPDRFVVIGAARDMTSTGNLDLGLGTAHLIEMAQAFVNIKFAEKWGPRRGVRFCSWGGGKSLRGLSEYLKMNKYVFGEQTLAYIDLDLYLHRTSIDKTIFEVSSSPALQMLVQHVLHQVPHPQDKQFTIADWQYDRPYNQFVTHGNQVIRDTLQNQGISVVSVGYMVNQNKNNEDSAVLHDALHHDQYHLAASRVLSLISLHLIDNNHLPLSLLNYTKFIHDVFGRSLVDLSKAEAVVDSEILSKTIDQLLRIGKAFEDFVNSKDFTRIPMGSRRMNDIKMGVDKIMISPQKLRYISPLLYGTAPDGSSLLLKEAIKTANITKDWKDVQSIVNAITRALEEMMSYLQLS